MVRHHFFSRSRPSLLMSKRQAMSELCDVGVERIFFKEEDPCFFLHLNGTCCMFRGKLPAAPYTGCDVVNKVS
jgi:hypothetical protein